MVPNSTQDLDTMVFLNYRDFGLKRTNPGGKLDYSLVNTIEYK